MQGGRDGIVTAAVFADAAHIVEEIDQRSIVLAAAAQSRPASDGRRGG
jgi:hypothetical protein